LPFGQLEKDFRFVEDRVIQAVSREVGHSPLGTSQGFQKYSLAFSSLG
jgi:hypothetical protein